MNAVLKSLARRIQLLFNRGALSRVNSGNDVQLLQVQLYADETLDDVEHSEPYGLTACPLPGAEVMALSGNGRRTQTVVINVADRRYRLKGLAEGEVALYDDQGQKIHLERDRVTIKSAGKVVVESNNIELGGADGQVVTTAHNCAYTGAPHPAGSSKCKAAL